MQSAPRYSITPLGTNRDQRRRFLLHHVPLAVASAVILALFMGLPLFDAHAYPHADIVSGTFPQERRDPGGSQTEGTDYEGRPQRTAAPGGGEPRRHDAARTGSMRQRAHEIAGGREGVDHAGTTGHSGRGRRAAPRPDEAGPVGHGGDNAEIEHGGGNTAPREDRDVSLTRTMQQLTVATGYLGLGLLAVTLLLGPANLLLRRRNPVSTYLRRDVGIWTAIFSVVHVFAAVLIHTSHGRGAVSSFLHFFIAKDGAPLTNSFGWGNWSGLAATAIALVLLATSNDAALRTLKASRWKWLQRLNYALVVLVVLHAFFYGAFLRPTSPFTLLLILSVIAVVVGQAVGVWLWRRRDPVVARSLGTFALVVFAAIVVSAVSAQSPRAERDTTANLTGAWTLNKDLSDDAGKVMEAMQGGDHGGSGGGRTPGGFGGHGPGMHGGGGTGGNRGGMTPEQMRARMGDVLEAPARITIVQSDGSVTVTDNHGRSQRLTTNNKKEKRPVDNRMVDVRAKWDDGRLINETWFGDRMKLTETYFLASGRRQLHVAVKLEGSHLPRSVAFRRVYDAESVR